MVIRTSEANVTVFDTNQCMYNLTVEGTHTFFVSDGDGLFIMLSINSDLDLIKTISSILI